MFKQQAFYIINEKLESSKVGAMAQVVEKNGKSQKQFMTMNDSLWL
jgi:general stress protein 26